MNGGDSLGQNPFNALASASGPGRDKPADAAGKAPPSPQGGTRPPESPKPRVRLEVRREKAGRGGKTVTLVRPLQPLPDALIEDMAEMLKRRLATGAARGRAAASRSRATRPHQRPAPGRRRLVRLRRELMGEAS
jgi:translation initiation factor 1